MMLLRSARYHGGVRVLCECLDQNMILLSNSETCGSMHCKFSLCLTDTLHVTQELSC